MGIDSIRKSRQACSIHVYEGDSLWTGHAFRTLS